jgi:cytoskeletal protein CcmA (bactofilin family)
MKRMSLAAVLILGALLLSACDQSGFVMIGLVSEGEHTFESSETVRGSIIISGGKVTVESGAKIDGDIYMLDGNLQVNGEISGDVSFIGGSLNLGPDAIIRGNLNIGGTQLTRSPEAIILGMENRGSGIQVPSLPETGGPTLGEQIIRSLIEGLILAMLAYVLMRYQRAPLHRVSEAIGNHPVVSLAMGMLVAIIGISLLITIAFTILLIPVTLSGLLVLGISIVYGWIACSVAGAGYVKQRWKINMSPEISAFAGAMALMMILNLFSRLSIIGSILLMLVSCMGLGAVFLTRLGLRRFEPATYWEDS